MPEEVILPDKSDTTAEPKDNGLDKSCTDTQNDEDLNNSGDEGNE